ncbi:MAG: ATP-binding protein [Bacteroidales bacterium]|jgi:predicted AAA+ superfamily ATPase|nr:ATP-binding protein [Bacteroidales bacterium]
MVERDIQNILENRFFDSKVIIVTGPRQVGKTTLLRQIAEKQKKEPLFLNCDDPEVRQMLTGINSKTIQSLFGNQKMIMIDEAQRVSNIGLILKLMVDNLKDVQIIVTGSSSFDLSNKMNEPLTGRKYTYCLYPFSVRELVKDTNMMSQIQMLEQRLLFGSYPDVVNNPGREREILLNIAESYLFKDILSASGLRKPAVLEKLVIALALQVGSEVSYSELANTVGVNMETVERYIDLLEKCFVVFRLSAFSRNLRSEIKKSRKIYFYDNGIRNAMLSNFQPLSLRQDVGALWENFIISERIKRNQYDNNYAKIYFWRTFQQQEIDYIEDKDGTLSAFEIKWNEKKRSRLPMSFAATYPQHTFNVINRENYMDFVG